MPNHNKPTTGFHTNPDRINKNGRPKREWTWAGLIEEQMEKLGPDKKAVKEAVAASLIAKALEGDVTAIKEVGNRIDGLPPQTINQSGDLNITYKPIMGGTADVSSDESLPQTPAIKETN